MKLISLEGCERVYPRLPGADFSALRCYSAGGISGGGTADTSSSTGEGSTTGAGSPQSIGPSSPVNAGTNQVTTTKGAVSLTTNETTDPAAFSTIASVVNAALGTTGQTQQAIQDSQNSNNDALNSILGQVVSADQAIAASTSSGGVTTAMSSALKLSLIGLAGFLGWLMFRKKSA